MKSNKVLKLLCSIFAGIGILWLIAGIITTIIFSVNKVETVEVYAEIELIDIVENPDYDRHDEYNSDKYDYHVYVTYEYEGENYEHVSLGSYSSSMCEGDVIRVSIDPRQPNRVHNDLTWLLVLIWVFGIAFTLGGGIPLIVMAKNTKKKKYLIKNGTVLVATIEDIVMNPYLEVNNVHPYNIYCIYHDVFQDMDYRFKSENIWLKDYGHIEVGSEIQVYVDPNDYSNHYVDTESLKNQRLVDFT